MRSAAVITSCLALAATGLALSCQLVGGYEAFDGVAVDAGARHPCDALTMKTKSTQRGPILTLVENADGTCFWMDNTEVTVKQYGAWLTSLSGAAPMWPTEPVDCSWKEADAGAGRPSDPAGNKDDACRKTIVDEDSPWDGANPIRCVDWCDAQAFCEWAGKRLCYEQSHFGADVEPSKKPHEWELACGAKGAFSYGSTPGPAWTCNIGQNPPNTCPPWGGIGVHCGPWAAGSALQCAASPSAPADLIGNVAEWINLCKVDSDLCHVRGGSFLSSGDTSCLTTGTQARNKATSEIGLRCCASLEDSELALTHTAPY